MAQMFPDRLPRSASKGEQRLFCLLQNLPEDHLVYYESLDGLNLVGYLVFAPDRGVLLLSVQGWQPGELLGGEAEWVGLKQRGVERREPNPLRRLQELVANRLEACRQSSALIRSALLESEGPNAGQWKLSFACVVVLANITAEQWQRHTNTNPQATAMFPERWLVTRDELLRWETLQAAAFHLELGRFFGPPIQLQPLNAEQIEALRCLFHPEVQLPGQPEATVLVTLDQRQEQHARALGEGHRLVYGVAGSGKTVLLLARARLLSQQRPEAAILVLCFNVSLAAYLKSCLNDCKNVHVYHFDAWCKANNLSRGWEPPESNAELGQRLLQLLQSGQGDARRYDAVLIDEAQDFDPVWFRCVLEALVDPQDGDLLIVGDRNQGLYGDLCIKWKELGINAQGRTVSKNFDLHRNYRNTREILALAAVFAQSPENDDSDRDEGRFTLLPVDPALAVRSVGVRPWLLTARDRKQETQCALAVVEMLLHGSDPHYQRLTPEQIGILYPWIPKSEEPLMEAFLSQLGTLAPVVRLTHGRDRYRVGEPGLKIQTIAGSKGLQYRAVILLWVDRLPRPFETSNLGEDSRLMYVALTRAVDYLFLIHSEPSAFVKRMQTSGLCDVRGAATLLGTTKLAHPSL
ncbi:MAG: UvrD-helicase domain-containing protein [Gemmataceae bacterium]